MGFLLSDELADHSLPATPAERLPVAIIRMLRFVAAIEKIAQSSKTGQPKRVLLSLATGAGKTFIAVHLLSALPKLDSFAAPFSVC